MHNVFECWKEFWSFHWDEIFSARLGMPQYRLRKGTDCIQRWNLLRWRWKCGIHSGKRYFRLLPSSWFHASIVKERQRLCWECPTMAVIDTRRWTHVGCTKRHILSDFKAMKRAKNFLVCHFRMDVVVKGIALLFCTANYASRTSRFDLMWKHVFRP